MNTAQNTKKVIIAAAIVAASAGLALSSCAGQRQLPEPVPDQVSNQIAEQRGAYRDLAERRAQLNRSVMPDQGELYVDQAERRANVTGPVDDTPNRDLAERQQHGLTR